MLYDSTCGKRNLILYSTCMRSWCIFTSRSPFQKPKQFASIRRLPFAELRIDLFPIYCLSFCILSMLRGNSSIQRDFKSLSIKLKTRAHILCACACEKTVFMSFINLQSSREGQHTIFCFTLQGPGRRLYVFLCNNGQLQNAQLFCKIIIYIFLVWNTNTNMISFQGDVCVWEWSQISLKGFDSVVPMSSAYRTLVSFYNFHGLECCLNSKKLHILATSANFLFWNDFSPLLYSQLSRFMVGRHSLRTSFSEITLKQIRRTKACFLEVLRSIQLTIFWIQGTPYSSTYDHLLPFPLKFGPEPIHHCNEDK